MAETSSTTTAASKPGRAQRQGTRSTAAKSPSKATGRRARTVASTETRRAVKANAGAAKTTADQGRKVAERAALVYVGATLEARDRAVALVTELRDVTGSRRAAEQRLARLERRGNKARTQLERDMRKARTRLERAVRTRRRDAERLASDAKERVTAIA